MRTFRDYFIMLSLPLAFIGAALLAAVDYVLALFPPGPDLALAVGGFPVERSQSGAALPRSLQNDMRHESRMARRSADRHI